MANQSDIEKAQDYFQKAYKLQMGGFFEDAVRYYKLSIEVYPTAEAHTFLGWTYSFMGLTAQAIEECKKAIEVDPDFGNPYNDIGAYLIEMGKFEEAIPWLKKAMDAPRYEAPHYPHVNLGRVYERLGKWNEAIEEYEKALKKMPDYKVAQELLLRLHAKMN